MLGTLLGKGGLLRWDQDGTWIGGSPNPEGGTLIRKGSWEANIKAVEYPMRVAGAEMEHPHVSQGTAKAARLHQVLAEQGRLLSSSRLGWEPFITKEPFDYCSQTIVHDSWIFYGNQTLHSPPFCIRAWWASVNIVTMCQYFIDTVLYPLGRALILLSTDPGLTPDAQMVSWALPGVSHPWTRK